MKNKLMFISLVLVLALSACGRSSSSQSGQPSTKSVNSTTASTSATTLSSQRAEKVAVEIEKGYFDSFDGYSDEEKERIKKAVEKDGYTLEYNEDGSGTLSNEEGKWFVGKGWVSDEYTSGLPEITEGTVTMSAEDSDSNGNFYIYMIRNATASYASEYVKKLISLGYEPDENYVNLPESGIVSFVGKNASGKSVEAAFSINGFTIKIYK